MNICAAGHKTHQTLDVRAVAGGHLPLYMRVFDYDEYQGYAGYCPGQDDISRTILNTATWEPRETKTVMDVLARGEFASNKFDRSGIVIDFGAHIGWYSLIAARLGYRVQAFEGDPNNLALLLVNAEFNDVSHLIDASLFWVDKSSDPLDDDLQVELIKIDLEGNELHAVLMCQKLIMAGHVNHALIEMSPVFNDTYPEIHNFMLKHGYDAMNAETGEPFDGNLDPATVPQVNVLYSRRQA